mmetsp:Transcript_89803/g.279420  ORF Transcript_89803/g.279420 Transcript_89803/m.279420 type:complete len:338 (+) Transcript_89803:148-1161(+)
MWRRHLCCPLQHVCPLRWQLDISDHRHGRHQGCPRRCASACVRIGRRRSTGPSTCPERAGRAGRLPRSPRGAQGLLRAPRAVLGHPVLGPGEDRGEREVQRGRHQPVEQRDEGDADEPDEALLPVADAGDVGLLPLDLALEGEVVDLHEVRGALEGEDQPDGRLRGVVDLVELPREAQVAQKGSVAEDEHQDALAELTLQVGGVRSHHVERVEGVKGVVPVRRAHGLHADLVQAAEYLVELVRVAGEGLRAEGGGLLQPSEHGGGRVAGPLLQLDREHGGGAPVERLPDLRGRGTRLQVDDRLYLLEAALDGRDGLLPLLGRETTAAPPLRLLHEHG